MDRYVIGVDGGASKTAAIVLDESRRILGRGASGSSNYRVVGLERTQAALSAAMQEACANAGLDLKGASAVTWALAGLGTASAHQLLAEVAEQILPDIPVRLEHDALAALVAGAGMAYGVVLNSGTGAIAYGANKEGQTARAAGWGYLFDQGNAYGLGLEALRAITLADDGIELPTQLTASILGSLGLKDPPSLIDWIYASDRQVSDVVGLAPLVLKTAEQGDLLATEMIVRGADALASAVDAVVRRLDMWAKPFPLILVGGLFELSELYRNVVTQAACSRIPAARPLRPRADAVVGAALLALETLGHALEAEMNLGSPEEKAWMSEQRNVLSEDLDLRSSLGVVGLIHLEDYRAVRSIRRLLPTMAHSVEAVASRMRKGGRLLYVGAGTSGRLGALDAAECIPTFGTRPGQVAAIIAGGNRALTMAVEAAEDNQEAGRQAIIEAGVGPLDSVVGVSASGRTPYVASALEEAKQRGALTIAVVCNLPSTMSRTADHLIAPLVGPEVLTGSTRLKAGTAQKLVLNMLSTSVMIRLGKTYANLMVDLGQQSAKLEHRARRIVAQACGISEEEASAALAASEGNVKVAIVSNLLNCSLSEARERLEKAGGAVRAALT